MTNQGRAQNTANISLHSLGQVVDPWYPVAPLPLSSWVSYEGWQQRLFNWRTQATRLVRNANALTTIWKNIDGFTFYDFRSEVWTIYKAVNSALAAEDYNAMRPYTTRSFNYCFPPLDWKDHLLNCNLAMCYREISGRAQEGSKTKERRGLGTHNVGNID